MKILLVRLRQIGDVVLTTPAVAALRRAFPDGHLTYLVEPPAAPIVAGNPHIDEVITLPRRRGLTGLAADVGVGLRLRRQGFDLVVDFHGGPRASLLSWLSAAPRRVGYDVVARRWMYTDIVDRPRELRARHSVENQWDLLRALGLPAPDPARNPLEMSIDPVAAADVDRRLAEAGIGPRDAIVVMHVSASSPFRRWPMPAFVETAAALASAPDRRVVVTSGPSERAAADAVIEGARARLAPEVRDRITQCGEFSLAELRALVERGALYIGGDSGPLHVAATSSIPIVAIFGPTPSERSFPWRDPAAPSALMEIAGLRCRPCEQITCEPGDFRCLTRIQPADVIAAAERLLSPRPSSTPTPPRS